MTRDEIIDAARTLIDERSEAFTLATVSPECEPHLRWMGAAVFEEPFTLYMVTYRSSRKVTDIRSHSPVEMLFSRADFSEQLMVHGPAFVEPDETTRKRIWDAIPAAAQYFDGPNDPEYIVLRVEAKRLLYWHSKAQRSPETAEL